MSSINEAYENNMVGTRKRLRSFVYEDLEITIHEWFKQHRALNLPINGPIVLKKAEYFATLHGYKDFKPSNGWLDRWKKRFGLSFVIMNGESEKVDDVTVDTWKARLSTLIASYAPNDIFNADETGLFFKCLPNKTLNPKGEKCFNGEKSKERLTILF